MVTRWTPYPHDLAFGSHFIYPRPCPPEDRAAQALKTFLLAVKMDRYAGTPPRRLLVTAVERIVAALQKDDCPYRAFFGADVMLVPCPGSGKMLKHQVSTPRALCIEFEKHGLGKMTACIERVKAVPKSAFAPPSQRPGPQQHYDSMRVEGGVEKPERIVVVDDIVTKGSTQIAAAARLSEVYTAATIRGFAVARTAERIDRNEDPVAGRIFVVNGQSLRRE